jgi:hypothetical protein
MHDKQIQVDVDRQDMKVKHRHNYEKIFQSTTIDRCSNCVVLRFSEITNAGRGATSDTGRLDDKRRTRAAHSVADLWLGATSIAYARQKKIKIKCNQKHTNKHKKTNKHTSAITSQCTRRAVGMQHVVGTMRRLAIAMLGRIARAARGATLARRRDAIARTEHVFAVAQLWHVARALRWSTSECIYRENC